VTSEVEWAGLIRQAQGTPRLPPPEAVEVGHVWTDNVSRPFAVACSDDQVWVAKAVRTERYWEHFVSTGHALAAEQVVGRLGRLIGAAVPPIGYVRLPAELSALHPDLTGCAPGWCHASKWLGMCVDQKPPPPASRAGQRQAYGTLAVLYGWCGADDRQVLQTTDGSGAVWSVDHGRFFGGTGRWNAVSLHGFGVPATLDPFFVDHGDAAATATALAAARAVDDALIAKVVGCSLPEWDVPLGDLVALAELISARRDALA